MYTILIMEKSRFNIFHSFFLLLIVLHYSISFAFFNGIVFPTTTDVFDSEIVFNKILGNIFTGDFYIYNSLLNGEYKWFYFTRIFFITNFFYAFFNPEIAFLLLDFLIKTFAYLSFFKLSKLFKNSEYTSFLLGIIYSYAATVSITDYYSSLFGFGSAVLPYLAYLTLREKKLKVRNYFIIIFSALNSHFYFAIIMIIFPFIIYFYNKNIYLKNFKIFFIFFIFCFIANSNVFYLALFNDVLMNRDLWERGSLTLNENIIDLLNNMFYLPFQFINIVKENSELNKILYLPFFFKNLPLFIVYTLTIILLFFKKIKKFSFFLITIFLILLICFFENTALYKYIVEVLDLGIISTIQLSRIKLVFTFIILLALANILTNKVKKYIHPVLIIVIILFQLNYMIVPYTKSALNYENLDSYKKIELKKNFINFNISELINLIKKNLNSDKKDIKFLTIKDYYEQKNYSYIKSIVKDDYVLPIDIDPAKLIYNRIKVLGGYFQFYPKSYKDQFRLIIRGELELDNNQKEIFDKEGHRLYASILNPNDIRIDFDQIKSMNGKYILSNKVLFNNRLKKICENCNKNLKLNLYFIN